MLLSIHSFSQSITEFHYDNAGGDVNEFVEITLPAGADPACYTVNLVNGSNATEYDLLTLDAAPTSADCNVATTDIYTISATGMQNGGPDGLALVDICTNTVIQFLSYEGTITGASFGGFTGQNSTDIGVAESPTGPTTGSVAIDGGTWTVVDPSTPGTPNDGSACGGGTTCSITGVMIMSAVCNGDNFEYEICATVANGSGEYSLIESGTSNPDIATESAPDGPVCFQVSIVGPTTAGSLDLDIVDTNDPTCAGGTPVTLTIQECPQTSNCPGVFISEFAYDCDTGDANELVEICIPNTFSGSLSDLDVELYNGNGGVVYSTLNVNDDFIQGTNDGTNTYYTFAGSGSSIQNGAPDGLALSFQGVNCNFISYEGTITATDGSANGMTSVDVMVEQTNSTTCDMSLQLCNGSWITGISSAGSANNCATGTCPSFTDPAPLPIIVNSTCLAGGTTPSGGSIDPPATDCPALSTLEYSEDGGLSWSTQPPTYNQAGPPQIIWTRCLCDDDMVTSSAETIAPATMPGACASCGAAISTFPANGN